MKLPKLVIGIAVAACTAVVLSKNDKVVETIEEVIDDVIEKVTEEREEKTMAKKIDNAITVLNNIDDFDRNTVDKAFGDEDPDAVDDALTNVTIGSIMIGGGGIVISGGILCIGALAKAIQLLRRQKLARHI